MGNTESTCITLGTYVFDTAEFQAQRDEEEDEESEDELAKEEEKIEENDILENDEIIDEAKSSPDTTIESQELPIPVKKYYTSSRIMETFTSFGTPGSSINENSNQFSSAEGDRKNKNVRISSLLSIIMMHACILRFYIIIIKNYLIGCTW